MHHYFRSSVQKELHVYWIKCLCLGIHIMRLLRYKDYTTGFLSLESCNTNGGAFVSLYLQDWS